MIIGVVKWFDDKKGFGFIKADGIEYFVHYTNILEKGHRTLFHGDEVSFEPLVSPVDISKHIATNVKIVKRLCDKK